MQQDKALAILKSGVNVFLTGSAGTGKTYILNQYIDYLRERKVPVAVTASTGIAATHMNGMTIHSWAGIGIKEKLTSGNLISMKSKKFLREHLEDVEVLIIDEISMLHKNQFNLVDKVLKYFKDSSASFGGIQIVVCGDFFQLPPIGKKEEKGSDKFSFMSQSWVEANLAICYLTEQFRQGKNDLNLILNEIRAGRISESSYNKLKATSTNKLSDDVDMTKLYTHNYDVDRINEDRLATITGESASFSAKLKGNKKLIETLKNSVLAKETIELKVGAKVMLVKNNNEKGYVNGSLAKVLAFNDKGFPTIQLKSGKIISVEQENWSVQDDHSKVLASFNQIPLRLAWAITVHKCQGMTLEEAEIDLSKTFEKGQGYVALSRLKKLENLRLIGLNEMALQVDSLCFKADQRFQELSLDADKNFSIDELERVAPLFIKNCGGIINPKEIRKNKNRLKEKKEKKDKKHSTYFYTLENIKLKKSIKEIAEIRGLAEATIASHFIKIKNEFPDADLSFYRPSDALIKKVKKEFDLQKKGEAISLKNIYEGLNKKVSYVEIKLAVAFL